LLALHLNIRAQAFFIPGWQIQIILPGEIQDSADADNAFNVTVQVD
jgi:hypothetical protein